MGWFLVQFETTTAMLLAATATAGVLAAVSLAMLMYAGANRRKSPYWYPMTLWVAHATLFYAANVTCRVFFDYARPTVFFSSWGVALYIQAFVSVIGVTLVKLRMER